MDMDRWLSVLPQFLVILPAAVSCYYTMKNQMKYTLRRTAALCMAVLLPYAFLCSCLCALLRIDANTILLPSLVLFFFPYRRTLTASLPKCLAIYVGVCAVQTFPAQFAYSLDAFLHPESGAAEISVEAAFFQLGLSCLIAADFAWPACKYFSGSLTVWTFPKYGTRPFYCRLYFCSSIYWLFPSLTALSIQGVCFTFSCCWRDVCLQS